MTFAADRASQRYTQESLPCYALSACDLVTCPQEMEPMSPRSAWAVASPIRSKWCGALPRNSLVSPGGSSFLLLGSQMPHEKYTCAARNPGHVERPWRVTGHRTRETEGHRAAGHKGEEAMAKWMLQPQLPPCGSERSCTAEPFPESTKS